MDGLKTCVVFGSVLLVLFISGKHNKSLILMLVFSHAVTASFNVLKPVSQSPPGCPHRLLCPTKRSSPCSQSLCSTSAAPAKDPLPGRNLCQKTPSFIRVTTQRRSSSSTPQWKTPATTRVCIKTRGLEWRVNREKRWTLEYMCLLQVNRFYFWDCCF